MIYHRDIGFPAHYRRPVGRHALTITRHAQRQSDERGIPLVSHVDMRHANVVEAGFNGTSLNHLLVRVAHNHTHDLAMAVSVERGKWILKTVWLNEITDTHNTLDRSKYATI